MIIKYVLGIDMVGESIIMCLNSEEKQHAQTLIKSKLPEVKFRPESNELQPSIKRALLETIVSGIASTREEIIEYTDCFIRNKKRNENESNESYLKWLETNKFISIVEKKDQDGKITECYKGNLSQFIKIIYIGNLKNHY